MLEVADILVDLANQHLESVIDVFRSFKPEKALLQLQQFLLLSLDHRFKIAEYLSSTLLFIKTTFA